MKFDRRAPTRGRLIFLAVVGAIVLLVEVPVLAVFVSQGTIGQNPFLRLVLPLALIAYAIYILWTSIVKLRAFGR